jgi:hypothetical protein
LETVKGAEKGVFLKEYKGYFVLTPGANAFNEESDIRPLVTNAMGGKDGLYATFTNLTYVSRGTDDNGYFQVEGLRVVKKKGDTTEVLAWLGDSKAGATKYKYKIRSLQKVTTQ